MSETSDLPVELLPHESVLPEGDEGIALCLSGGGYRAMVFHLGALWRLYELDLLGGVERISSVSGGSITAGALALAWPRLSFQGARVREDFVPHVVEPVRRLAGVTIDRGSILRGLFLPGSISSRVAAAYDEHLFRNATLQALPDKPRFVINATNLQSTVLWRFMKPYMRDWRVGEVKNPSVRLSTAVAASSAFPPVLSPMILELDPRSFTPGTGQDLQREPYTQRVVLSDGGVYDNLGLETAFKRYRTILVSDGGGKTEAEPKPKRDWARQSLRVLNTIDNQVRSLRKRQLISAYQAGRRLGAFWSTRTDIRKYPTTTPLNCPLERTLELARVATRLAKMPEKIQERLVNWGYAVCDAALRAHFDKNLPQPTAFPYPSTEV